MAFSKDPALRLNIYNNQRPTAAKVLPAGPSAFKGTGSSGGGGGRAIVIVALAAVLLFK